MQFYKLLPCEPTEVNEWVFGYLKKVHASLAAIIEDTESAEAEMRARNERLSSYLGMLNTVLTSFRQKMDSERNRFVREHPRPERGVTEWRDNMDARLAECKRICEHVEGVIKAIETRLSITQSNLKNMAKES
jgi:ABC-type transporter Mla subunit MlaD